MSPQITCRNVELPDDTRERLVAKTAKLRRYFDRIQDVDVVISQEKLNQIVEVVLHCDGVKIKAQEANEELLNAMDRVFEKVERQIKKYKRRLIDSRRRGGVRRTMNATETVMAAAVAEVEEEEDLKKREHVIDVEHREILTLNPDEAAMHLDLSGAPFFVFLNSENHHINIICKRSDGHLGLIEPVI